MKSFSYLGLKSLPLAALFLLVQCESGPAWESTNNALIEEHSLSVRNISNLPDDDIESNLPAGEVTSLEELTSASLATGVTVTMYWGDGTLTSIIEMEPGSQIAEEELPSDRIAMVMEGSVQQLINGSMVTMESREREAPDGTHSATPRRDFVFLQKGTSNAVTAGANGAKLLEVSSPIRLDYLEKAGVTNLPTSVADLDSYQTPNVDVGKVYDLYDIQLTELATGAFSRLVSGRNMQLSFISMAPGSTFPHHIHPEEQIMLVFRGECDEILLDGEQKMIANSVVRIPGNMVHGANNSDLGADALDLFWPARADYLEKEKTRLNAYHAIIPKDAEVELVIDGTKTEPSLTFSEGPKWLNGKIYFSNMYFDQNWGADPSQSSTVEMDPDGSYRNIAQGMQTNGLYPYKNGNLVVCDMMGPRVVEMTPNGRVVRVLANEYDGKSIDGPNDVVTDAKGGLYFTDPQFTMEPEKFQPGRNVYYLSPEGDVTRLFEPNEFAMPNGIILSPDGKTLYVNNTYDDESWYPVNSEKDNWIWAYDVNDDGTVSSGRQFAELFLTSDVLDRKGKSTSADGMAIDTEGNLYVATYYGVQIFDKEGVFVGMINLPSFPVSLCFGDQDMQTLYMVSYSYVYKIRTNKKGFVQYL